MSVRSEVCITCGNLEIKDEEVVAKLLHLATFDTIWKVKALAFQGKFRSHVCLNPFMLMWMMPLQLQLLKSMMMMMIYAE